MLPWAERNRAATHSKPLIPLRFPCNRVWHSPAAVVIGVGPRRFYFRTCLSRYQPPYPSHPPNTLKSCFEPTRLTAYTEIGWSVESWFQIGWGGVDK